MYQSRCTAKNSWWWAERLPETCKVVILIKLDFSASVGFIHKESVSMHGPTILKCLNMFDLNSSQPLCCPTVLHLITNHTALNLLHKLSSRHHCSYFRRRQTGRMFQCRDYNMVGLDSITFCLSVRLSVWVQVTFTYGCDPTSQSRFVLRIISAPTGKSLLPLEVN